MRTTQQGLFFVLHPSSPFPLCVLCMQDTTKGRLSPWGTTGLSESEVKAAAAGGPLSGDPDATDVAAAAAAAVADAQAAAAAAAAPTAVSCVGSSLQPEATDDLDTDEARKGNAGPHGSVEPFTETSLMVESPQIQDQAG